MTARRSLTRTGAVLTFSLLSAAWSASAETERVTGPATVISGDTLVVAGQRIRLYGIDAPEKGQTCVWPNKTIDCGNISRTALLDLIAPVAVTCRRRHVEPDGSWLASCKAEGFDVATNLIHTGWAVILPADPAGLKSIQANAKAGKRGLWRGTFQMPWVWRRAQ